LLIGAVVDLCAGIVLHFGVQIGLIDRWLVPSEPGNEITAVYSLYAQHNLQAKLSHQWIFAGDLVAAFQPAVLIGLIAMLATAIALSARSRSDTSKS
jgi:hypothetical protein